MPIERPASDAAVSIPCPDEVEHGVLQNLGVDRQVRERTLGEATNNSVGNRADAGLQRQQVLGQATTLHFVSEELHDVTGDCFGGVVHVGKGAAFVAVLRLDHGDDFLHVAGDIGSADAAVSAGDQEGGAMRWLLLHVNVVHAFERRLTGVDFEDDLVAEANSLSNDTAGRGQSQAAVFGDSGDFKDADVVTAVLGVETVADVLGEVTEVLVAHADPAGVDSLGDVLAGLVRPAAVDHVQGGPTIFSLSTDRGTDEEVELQLTLQVVGFDVISQCDGYRFGITGRGKTGPYQVLACAEELDGVFSLHNLAEQGLATNSTFQSTVIGHFSPP